MNSQQRQKRYRNEEIAVNAFIFLIIISPIAASSVSFFNGTATAHSLSAGAFGTFLIAFNYAASVNLGNSEEPRFYRLTVQTISLILVALIVWHLLMHFTL